MNKYPFSLVGWNEAKEPAVHWKKVVLLAGGTLIGYSLAHLLLGLVFEVPFRIGILSAFFSVQLGVLVTLVEVQRQRLTYGSSFPQFNLRYLFVMTLLAALFLGSIVAELNATRQGFQRNQEIKEFLEQKIGGGQVYLGGSHGKRISCQITRSTFSDDELIDLLKSLRDCKSGVDDLMMLNLEATAVTDRGIQGISDCSRLEFIALPSIALSDSTIESLASMRKLRFLSLDSKKLTESQWNRLCEKLPTTKINGLDLRERRAITGK